MTSIEFVGENTSNDNRDYGSDLVRQLQNSMEEIKKSREMGRRFMLMKDLLRDERKAGYKEGHKKGHEEGHKDGIEEHNIILQEINCALEKFDAIPGFILYQLFSQTDLEVLKQIKELARKSTTLDEFQNNIQILLDTNNKSENNS